MFADISFVAFVVIAVLAVSALVILLGSTLLDQLKFRKALQAEPTICLAWASTHRACADSADESAERCMLNGDKNGYKFYKEQQRAYTAQAEKWQNEAKKRGVA